MERLRAFWRAGIVGCRLSATPRAQRLASAERVNSLETAKRSERREEGARHQVNTAVAMKILPPASTVPTPTRTLQDSNYQ